MMHRHTDGKQMRSGLAIQHQTNHFRPTPALLMGKENITPYVIPETAQRLSGIQYF
jgi:hypothetical protein